MKFKEEIVAYTYDDVLIEPKFSAVTSRKDVDISQVFLDKKYKLPVMSSNMDTVTGVAMANAMNEYGASSCLHRFWSIEDNIKAFQQANGSYCSFGVGKKELERFEALYDSGCRRFILDVAHGASTHVVKQVNDVRSLRKDFQLIVGNFATAQTIHDFNERLASKFSVNAYKNNIGSGSHCTTRVVTGCGVPSLSSLIDCVSTGLPIIADGGIKNSGDFAKAIMAGASMVMVGKLLAGTDEAPGELIQNIDYTAYGSIPIPSPKYKRYRGSASKDSYKVQGKESSWRTPEGESSLVLYKGPVASVLNELEAGLRSALSYTGSFNLDDFRANGEMFRITPSGVLENGAHGKA